MQVDACRFGIITALPKEYAALTIMLDNVKACPVADDPNEYVMATIPAKDGRAVHLVAVTLLKEAGNNSAASAASHLLRSFPKVQDVLMVGIAGGIPNPTDVERHVRLGDIVVSDREGIIQYDNLKNSPEGIKIRSASEKPSARMLTRVRHLEAGRMKGSRPWTQYLRRGAQMEDGKRPSDETDCLYVVNGGKEEQVPHPEDPKRIYGEPKIHYGRIGAANTLLKNPTLRDALGNDHNVKAIEMEGAGIADGAWSAGQHYILIRGISDYCEPWKNDLWQGYAAIAAASYARALIESFPSETDGGWKPMTINTRQTRFRRYFDRTRHADRIYEIVRLHESTPSVLANIDGFGIQTQRGVFNPAFGTFSRALQRVISKESYEGSIAVDLGCGSGFIACGLAKREFSLLLLISTPPAEN